MPTVSMKEVFASKSRILHRVENGECSCIVPLNIGEHWVTLTLDADTRNIIYFDSLGQAMTTEVYDSVKKRFPAWQIVDSKIRTQADGYQCGIWTFIVTKCYLRHLSDHRSTKEIHSVDLRDIFSRNKTACLTQYQDLKNQEYADHTTQALQEPLSCGIRQ